MQSDSSRQLPSENLVTVMIPCFNQGKELPKAIESALRQSYSPLEIIIADDCSTDNTELVVKKYLDDNRVRYIKNKTNIGRVANYHKLVFELSSGSWLVNLDGDDYWANDTFIETAMKAAMVDTTVSLVFGRQKYYNKSIDKLWENPPPKVHSLMDGKELFLKYPSLPEGVPHMAALYKKAIALRAEIFKNNIIFADSEAMLRLLPFGKVAYINIFAGVWNDHGNNASYTPQIEQRIENHLMIKSPYDFFSKMNLFDPNELLSWREKFLTRMIRETCCFYLDNYDIKNCFKYLNKASSDISTISLLKILFNPRFLIRLFFFKAHLQIKKLKGLLQS
jgi:glycosyltransferase involved in cell wall biosynthesis